MTTALEDEATGLQQTAEAIDQIAKLYQSGKLETLEPILPVLSLKGEAYRLTNHAPFWPMFKTRLTRRTLWKCGRQVSKTTSMSAQSVLQTASEAHFSTLFVAPRYEQIRRVSSNFVRPFIENSLIQHIIINKHIENSVLQKTFLNGSKMHFSFAFLDAERIRGLDNDCVKYDEIQDIDIDFIPIIRETMSASRFAIEMFFGTPKTLDNTIQVYWENSSQAEWVIRCTACNHENIPAADYHLLKMIGPVGPSCARCGRVVNPRLGRWIHAYPDRTGQDCGYHVPQIILPMHYEHIMKDGSLEGTPPADEASDKWLELLGKRDGRGGYDKAKFMNEVLGESCDTGIKLVTLTDIRNASVLNKNDWRSALDQIKKYRWRALGVDWGGGGENEVSFTTCSVVGFNPVNGKSECIFAKRFHSAYTHDEEAKELLEIFKAFQCLYFAHDYGGSGSVRETLMLQAGLPLHKIVPFMYIRATAKKMVEAARPGSKQQGGQRFYYTLDKARSLVLQAGCLKNGLILLPEYESSKDITHDLLALMEDKHDTPGGADVYLIRRNAKMSDDFAHALNYACVAIWHMNRCYPDLSLATAIKLTTEQKDFFDPPNPKY